MFRDKRGRQSSTVAHFCSVVCLHSAFVSYISHLYEHWPFGICTIRISSALALGYELHLEYVNITLSEFKERENSVLL